MIPRRRFLVSAGLLGGAAVSGCMGSQSQVSPEFKAQYMDPGPLRDTWTQVKGIRMHALTSTERAPAGAPAVVLVHGSGLSGQYMIPTARELTPHVRVYVPDMPGFGKSDKPDEVFDVPALADWLVAWMPSVELRRASFLGNSFGCQVIADLAARHPSHVDHAILQGPTTPPDERSVIWQFIRWRQNQRYNPDWLGEVTAEAYDQAGWWRMLRSFFIQISDPIEEKAPRIVAPVLVVRGEHDPIANQEWCERLARLCPRGELALIPDVAHTLCFTAPVPLAEVTRRFVLKGDVAK